MITAAKKKVRRDRFGRIMPEPRFAPPLRRADGRHREVMPWSNHGKTQTAVALKSKTNTALAELLTSHSKKWHWKIKITSNTYTGPCYVMHATNQTLWIKPTQGSFKGKKIKVYWDNIKEIYIE